MNVNQIACARCRLKPAVYSCTKCEPYVNFCIQCDNYVHSMNSKKNHKRNVIQPDGSVQNNQSGKDNDSSDGAKLSDTASKYLSKHDQGQKSSQYLNSSQNYERPNIGSPYRTGSPRSRSPRSRSPYRTLEENDQQYRRNVSNYPAENLKNQNSQLNESLNQRYKINSNDTLISSYSKDYINEIKNLYEKEKQDLLYRNSTLQSNLDFTKATLSDKISSLEFKLDETTKKNSLNTQIMEDEFNLQMKRLMNEKEMEIKNHLYTIEDLEKLNKELNFKLNESLKNNSDLKNYYKNMISDLEYEYKVKDKEYLDLKSSFENKMNFYTTNFEEEKSKLIRNYEDNFDKMSRAHKESKDKLNSIIYQREVDLKNIMDKNRDEEIKSQAIVNDLRKEVNFRKNESDSVRGKNQQHINEIEILQRSIERGKKETHDVVKEVKMLEADNRKKTDEVAELKIMVEKLSGIVYGKLKNKPDSANTTGSSKNLNSTVRRLKSPKSSKSP